MILMIERGRESVFVREREREREREKEREHHLEVWQNKISKFHHR